MFQQQCLPAASFVVVCLTYVTSTVAGVVTHQSLRHTNKDQTQNVIEYSGSVPNAIYTFDVQSSDMVGQPNELSTRASLQLAIDADPVHLDWNSSHACASASATFFDTTTVQGAGGTAFGTAKLSWTVIGNSKINLNTQSNDNVRVFDLSTETTLTAKPTGQPEEVFMDEFHTYSDQTSAPSGFKPFSHPNTNCPLGNQPGFLAYHESINEAFHPDSIPAAAGVFSFELDWVANSDVVVEIAMNSTVNLMLETINGDALQTTVELDADFFNTAHFESVEILDPNGVPIQGAYLESSIPGYSYPMAAVPEPNAALLIAFVGMIAVCFHLCHQKLPRFIKRCFAH